MHIDFLSQEIRSAALAAGADMVGFAPVVPGWFHQGVRQPHPL